MDPNQQFTISISSGKFINIPSDDGSINRISGLVSNQDTISKQKLSLRGSKGEVIKYETKAMANSQKFQRVVDKNKEHRLIESSNSTQSEVLMFDENEPLPSFDLSIKKLSDIINSDQNKASMSKKIEQEKRKKRFQMRIFFLTYLSSVFLQFQREFWSMSKKEIQRVKTNEDAVYLS